MSDVVHTGAEAITFDPERLGALCSKCFLSQCRAGGPVPSEFNKGATVALVGEAPGKEEVEEMRPFIGASGREMMVALNSIGVPRSACMVTNAMLCRLPPVKGESAMEVMNSRLAGENKRRAALGEEPWLHPVAACRPRLHNELAGISNVITVGKWGMRGVTGMTNSIMDVRGAPMTGILGADGRWREQKTLDPALGETGHFVRLLPTVHPAFVLRARRWTKVFRTDVARAFQWFSGRLGYVAPSIVYQPALKEARDFLYSGAPFFAYDLETDAKESLVAKIRCIGIGTPEACILVPFKTCEYEPTASGKLQLKEKRFYASSEEEAAMVDLLRSWLTDQRILKVGWNIGAYDRLVIEQQWHVTPAPIVDGIVLHRAIDSELPHNLAFVAPLYTPVARAWKASHAATTAQSDEELHEYCVHDTVNTARLMEPLQQAIHLRGQAHLAPQDHKLQAICAGLHRNGLFVNQATRRQLDEQYRQEALAARSELRLILGNRDFNPHSVPAVREALFERFALPPQKVTPLGQPSTDAETLKLLLVHCGGKHQQHERDFIRAVRRFRRSTKFRGTFIRPLRPYDEPAYGDELAVDVSTVEGAALQDEVAEAMEDAKGELSAKQLKKLLDVAPGLVLADGRVHSQWNSHVPVTWRVSSSEPNCQNLPDPVRVMFEAEAGRLFAYSDYDQLELRISAALAGDEFYLDAFHRALTDPSIDVHAITATDLYGDLFKNGAADVRKRIRDFAKRFVYAITYGAKVPTIHRTLSLLEGPDGELLFPWFTMKDAGMCVERWLRRHPAYPRWWENTLSDFRRDGFLADPVEGHKRFFMDGEDENEEKNFRVQCAGASVINRATIALVEGPLPFEKWGPGTGLVQQGHDSVVFEVAESEAARVCGWLKEAMTMKLPNVPHEVMLTVKPKIGKTWAACA